MVCSYFSSQLDFRANKQLCIENEHLFQTVNKFCCDSKHNIYNIAELHFCSAWSTSKGWNQKPQYLLNQKIALNNKIQNILRNIDTTCSHSPCIQPPPRKKKVKFVFSISQKNVTKTILGPKHIQVIAVLNTKKRTNMARTRVVFSPRTQKLCS